MTNPRPKLHNAQSLAVTDTSAKFAAALQAGKCYRITGDVPFWYEWDVEGATVVAGEAGAVLVPASHVVFDTPAGANVWLHIIRSGAVSGLVSIAQMDGGV